MPRVDLQELSRRESEQTEWKADVADIDDVVATLAALANDLQNLGGGYVVCGAREEKGSNGFPVLVRTGLSASRFKAVEGTVLTRCRERVSPPITPLIEELPSDNPDRRILVFIQPATGHAHTYRKGTEGAKHYVRVSRTTIEARNGLLRDLLVRKGAMEPWDRRPCDRATVADLDLLALRDALTRLDVFAPDRGVESYLVPDVQMHALVPALCVAEPLTGAVRPRNFAVLLFGREPQKFIPGAFSLFSTYPGRDRSDPHAERHEIGGTVLDQARRLTALLAAQATTIFDKEDVANPNKVRYPIRALTEALGNTLAHRDYELYDPVRITAFADRIEFVSPGSLPLGVDPVAFREGRAGPHWRNQVLAWFFNRLGLAQAEGQGIQTMLRIMRQEGCPPPAFEASEVRVGCTLGANPLAVRLSGRHAGGQNIDRDAKRDALLRTIVAAGERGIRRVELAAVLPQASDNEIKVLLRDLRRLRKIHARGATAAARWYRGPERGQQ
ncbi:MAG: ATP-binding protein [Deltaproteobacteria bacterium]|nr:ATP-binding protein [Deltaproteobacteria bacterium]